MIGSAVLRKAGTFAIALAFAVAANLAAAEILDDQQPMYGGVGRLGDPALRTADETFVNAVISTFGGRREGSAAIADDGWVLFRQNDDANAMRRFNQAWLVDPDYYDVYWGFGAILLVRGEIENAIAMLERANAHPDVHAKNRAPLMGDLANLYALKAYRLGLGTADRAAYFERANAMFAAAVTTDPANPQAWLQWIVGLFYQARYGEAWEKVAAARDLGHSVPEQILGALRAKLPEPAR